MTDNNLELTLLNNKQWSIVESKLCRIINFNSIASVRNGKIITTSRSLPYASIIFECSSQTKKFKGFITHKEDFKNLWTAFEEREIDKNEEVLFFWSQEHYKNMFYSMLSMFMPKLWVMICNKNSFELHTNSNFKPELTGEARWLASQPIKEYKPDVIE